MLKTVTVILMAAIVLPKMMGFHVGCAPKIVLDYALTEMECPSPFVHLMWSLRVCVSSDVTQPSLLIPDADQDTPVKRETELENPQTMLVYAFPGQARWK